MSIKALQQTAGHDCFLELLARRCPAAAELCRSVLEILTMSHRECIVCHHAFVAPDCANCGANFVSVHNAINTAAPPTIPAFWDMLLRNADGVNPLSETIWTGLSPEFRSTLIKNYTRLSRRGRTITSIVMFPLVIALLATCFWAGVGLARFCAAPGGRVAEWLFGAGAILVLLPLRVFPVGSFVERLLLSGRTERAAHAVLQQFALIGPAIIKRCRVPWYLNPDVYFPFGTAAVLVLGWLLV